jgi:toxin ParE1/3/4
MASYELSARADHDLTEIYVYSYREFGEQAADNYLMALHDCFTLLAHQPDMGRSIEYVRRGYFRFEHAHHTIFYIKIQTTIRIMRVLHERMDPDRNL